jgi:hypothetical protein
MSVTCTQVYHDVTLLVEEIGEHTVLCLCIKEVFFLIRSILHLVNEEN